MAFTAGLRLLWTIGRDFFFPQFHGKYLGGNYPLTLLEHPLDRAISFEPRNMKLYLSFAYLWLKSLVFLYRTVGSAFLPELRNFLIDLEALYYKTGVIYKTRQSTTPRPEYPRGLEFLLVKLMDPHRHCFPSLHVEIVFFNYFKLMHFEKKFGQEHPEIAQAVAYGLEQAHQITESVLLVKQHSIHCISGAFFFLKDKAEGADRNNIQSIINNLFQYQLAEHGIREACISQIQSQFMSFCEAENSGENKKDILLKFLQNFESAPKDIRINKPAVSVS